MSSVLRFTTAISSRVSSDLCEFSPIKFYQKLEYLIPITSIIKSTKEVFWSIFRKGSRSIHKKNKGIYSKRLMVNAFVYKSCCLSILE